MFRLGRWAIDAVVTLFALYALVYIPLGQQTGYEHLKDILSTREAREAGQGLMQAAHELRKKLLADLSPIETQGTPVLPSLPRRGPNSDPPDNASSTGQQVGSRPVPSLAKVRTTADAGVDASQ